MKNLGIKLISVFIVLQFCLSPLGAIDLDQGNNATHVNNTNNTDKINENDTFKVNDSIDKINLNNETDDLKNDVKCKNLSSNDTNSSKNLKGYDLGFRAEIADCTYGQSPVLKIWCTNKYFSHADFDISVTGNGYSNETTVCLWGSYNEVKLSDGLAPGRYTVTVKFVDEYGYFNNKTITHFITVEKLSPMIKAEVKDVELGKNPVLKVTCDKGLKGNFTISSNFSDENFRVDASHDSFSYVFDKELAPGNYYCFVSYSGDDIHATTLRFCFFKVYKHDPNFSVQADDIVEGDKIIVKFHANKSLNCNANYTVLAAPSTSSNSSLKLGTTHAVRLVNGQAYAVLDNNLGPGRYFVSADCEGDDKFKEAHASTEFKINPA